MNPADEPSGLPAAPPPGGGAGSGPGGTSPDVLEYLRSLSARREEIPPYVKEMRDEVQKRHEMDM